APPMGGPETVNLISIVFANDSTSFISSPSRMRVPPPAAPPRNELITAQPSASVSGSFQLKIISGALFSYFFNNSFISMFLNLFGYIVFWFSDKFAKTQLQLIHFYRKFNTSSLNRNKCSKLKLLVYIIFK